MKIKIKSTNLKLTPFIYQAIEEKIGSLAKFLKKFEVGREVLIRLEIEKITRHHRKGNIFRVEANLLLEQVNLPRSQTLIRSESLKENIYSAIVEVKDELRRSIKKHKLKSQKSTPHLSPTKILNY